MKLYIKQAPKRIVLLYMIFVFLLYMFSALNWTREHIFLMIIFYISILLSINYGFECGYRLPMKNKKKIFINNRWLNILLILCVIDLYPFLMVSLASETVSLNVILSKIVLASQGFGDAYYERGENILAISIFENSWLLYHFLFSPLCTLVIYNCILFFSRVSIFQRTVTVFVVVVQVCSYIIVGTNKLIFDYLALFFFALLLSTCKNVNARFIKLTLGGKNVFLLVVLVLAALIFFCGSYSSRIQDKKSFGVNTISGNKINSENMVLVPEDMRSSILGFSSYLTQGLEHLDWALGMDFQWCYGLGSSKYLANFLQKMGVDADEIEKRTYEYRISQKEGVKNGQYWYSAYVAFANDVTFFFVPMLIFIFAIMWGHYWKLCLNSNDLTCFPIFVLLGICFFYLNANNQIFGKAQLLIFIPLYVLSKFFDIQIVRNK